MQRSTVSYSSSLSLISSISRSEKYMFYRLPKLAQILIKQSIIHQMDIQREKGLSMKSRGILYHLKKALERNKLLLDTHICNIFDYRKEKFNHKEFQKLIKKYDANLLYDEIDQLFEELDENKNNYVFYEALRDAYKNLTETDNPAKRNNLKNSSKFSENSEKGNSQEIDEIIGELKGLLVSCDNYLEILGVFDTEREGYLNKENMIQLLKSFDYNNNQKITVLIKHLFKDKSKMSIQNLIDKLNLRDSAKRMSLSKLEVQKSIIIEHDQKSVHEYSRLSIPLEESFALEKSSTSGIFALQDIPEILQPYFNYGSELDEKFAFLACQYLHEKLTFMDEDNPPFSTAYNWVHISQSNLNNYSLFKVSKSLIHRDSNRKGLGMLLQPKDIIQGNLGDCYFLSAIAGVVEQYPELIYRLFILEVNPAHIYGVKLFVDGLWQTVVLDIHFPVSRNGGFIGAQPHNQQIWVMLLEKAWAKVFKSYDSIISGYNEEGLNAISGAPSVHVSTRDDGFLKRIQIQLMKGSILTCATSAEVGQMTETQQSNIGIYSNHAYSILKIFANLPVGDRIITLIKIRNPWGRKEWKGAWSYNSPEWGKYPGLKDLVNIKKNPNDGSFFMSLEDFLIYFDHVNICRINLGYRNSHITVESDRETYSQSKVKISKKGDYYFTLYQENPRKYKSYSTFQKSKSWLFLCELKNGKINAVGSKATDNRNNTLEASLEQGTYVIISRVSWKYWQAHEYNLTSYGPQRVQFQAMKDGNMFNLADFIQSKSKLGFGQVGHFKNLQIIKRTYFNQTQGFGFILIQSNEKRVFELTIHLDPCKGIFILPPFSLPLKIQVFPGDPVVCKFIVDPRQYMYQYRETYRLL